MRVFADPVSSHTATRARPAVKSLRSDNRSHDRDRAFLRPPTGLSERYEPAASLHLILHQGNMRRMFDVRMGFTRSPPHHGRCMIGGRVAASVGALWLG